MMFTATVYVPQRLVVQAVPFWIVERSSEIADREKTVTNERRGAWGGQEKEERKRNYPVEEMCSNQCLCQAFHIIPFLNLTYASTLLPNCRTIGKILDIYYKITFICWIANYPVDKIIHPLNY